LATARYCLTCGTPLVAGAPPITPPVFSVPQPPPYPYGSAAGYWEYHRAHKIDNTKTGLLLLIIGLAISWIPVIGAIGGLVALIGALLVILGREAFGREHARNAILALIVFFVGIGVTIVGFVVLFFAAFSYRTGPINIFQPTFAWLGVITVIGGGVTGISEVLLTYALQLSTGRILLWTAYAASIAISVANFLFVLPFFGGAGVVFSAFFLQSFLGIIPALLYAAAYYLARQRIVHREIPSPLTPPFMPPSGGIPPTSGGG
jgi:hypothetical protein